MNLENKVKNRFNITAVLKGYRKYAGSYKWTYKN